MVEMQKTFVLIKPDGVERGLKGEIISRFEKLGFRIIEMRLFRIDRELAETHYSEHKNADFYEPLIEYITSGKSLAMVLEGGYAVEVIRKVIGDTDGKKAIPGTIRGDYCVSVRHNIVHGSSSIEAAKREIELFFPDREIDPL